MARKPKGAGGCFYSSLTGAQLTELLRALGLPSSGLKPALVARLRASPAAAPYADEGRSGTLSRTTLEWVGARPGMQLPEIKDRCRAAGLKVTGTKYDLVLQLLRSAGPGGARAEDAAKPRAPSTKPADPQRIRERILAKCQADASAWSGQRCNEHADDVFAAAEKILAAEANGKGLLAARNPALADAAVAVLSAIREGWGSLCRPSYGNAGYNLRCIFELVRSIGQQMGAQVPADTRAALQKLCTDVAAEASRYGMELDGGTAAAFA